MKQPAREIKYQLLGIFIAYLSLFSISLILQLNDGATWASLSSTSIKNGEYWRLISAHLTHLDWHHFYMNIIGMGLCLLVFRHDLTAKHWLASFLFISLFSSLGLLSIYDEYQRYVGFSDVLHGWILLGAISIIARESKLSLAIFILFWIKLIEENSGLQFFTNTGMDQTTIATESHLFGALGGMLYGALFLPEPRQWLLAKMRKK